MSLLSRFLTSYRVPDLGGAESPGLVLGDDDVVYLIKPDGSRDEVGSGGGSQPLYEMVIGNPVTIANGAAGLVTFDSKLLGDDLLDLTDPTQPLLAIGTYIFVTRVDVESGPISGPFRLTFSCSSDNESFDGFAWVPFMGSAFLPGAAVVAAGRLTSPGTVTCQVDNFCGGDFDFQMLIAEITKLA